MLNALKMHRSYKTKKTRESQLVAIIGDQLYVIHVKNDTCDACNQKLLFRESATTPPPVQLGFLLKTLLGDSNQILLQLYNSGCGLLQSALYFHLLFLQGLGRILQILGDNAM